jgi:hypothetical protein
LTRQKKKKKNNNNNNKNKKKIWDMRWIEHIARTGKMGNA